MARDKSRITRSLRHDIRIHATTTWSQLKTTAQARHSTHDQARHSTHDPRYSMTVDAGGYSPQERMAIWRHSEDAAIHFARHPSFETCDCYSLAHPRSTSHAAIATPSSSPYPFRCSCLLPRHVYHFRFRPNKPLSPRLRRRRPRPTIQAVRIAHRRTLVSST